MTDSPHPCIIAFAHAPAIVGWGINLYPGLPPTEWVEFDSMINIRPSQDNRSRGVDDPLIRIRILEIVASLVRE